MLRILSLSSPAALSVNVNATISAGLSPLPISLATLRLTVSVLPEPGHAIILRCPRSWSMMRLCSLESLNFTVPPVHLLKSRALGFGGIISLSYGVWIFSR